MADGTVKITIEADGNKAIKSANDLEDVFGKLGKGGKTNGLTGDLDDVVTHSNKTRVSIKDLAVSMGLVKVASAAFGVLKSSIGGAVDRFDTLNKYPVVMKALGYSTKDVTKSVKTLNNGIDGLPTSLDEISAASQQLAPLTGGADSAAKSAVALNDAFLASGASTADAGRGMQQYTQMLSTGKVDLMSWRTLQETMPVALRKTANAFGYTGKSAENDLFKALQGGKITIEQLNNKFVELDKGQNGFANLARKNSAGIKTSFGNLKTAVVKGLADTMGAIDSGLAKANLPGIATILNSLKPIIANFFKAFNDGVSVAIPIIANFVKSLAPIFTSISKFISGISDGSKNMGLALKVAFGVLAAMTVPVGVSMITGIFSKLLGSLKPIGSLFKPITSGFSLLGKGLGGIGTLVKGVGSAFQGLANAILKVGVGIGVASAGLALLVFSLTGLANTGNAGVIAMVAFGATVAILAGVFALLGGPLTTGAVGIAAFGIAVLAVGVGIGIASAGIALLVLATTGLIAAFIQLTTVTNLIIPTLAALGTGFATMILSFLTVIQANMPVIISTFISGLNQMIVQATTLIPQLIALGIAILTALLSGISKNIGQLTTKAIEIITKFFTALAAGVPKMMDAGVKFIVAVLNGIARNVPKMIGAAVSIIVSFINGIARNLNRIVTAAMNLVDAMVTGILNAQNRLFSAGTRLINGFATNIRGHTGEMRSAALNLLDAIIRVFVPGSLVDAGEAIINGFIKGLKVAWEAGKKFVSGIATWIKDHKGPISYDRKLLIPAGKAIVGGLNEGLVNSFGTVQNSVTGFASSIAESAVITMPAIEDSAFNKSLKRINALLNGGNLHASLSGITTENMVTSRNGILKNSSQSTINNSRINNVTNNSASSNFNNIATVIMESNNKVIDKLNEVVNSNNHTAIYLDGDKVSRNTSERQAADYRSLSYLEGGI
ncbi:hypothetical protein LABALGNA3A7_05180 [Dellaglioa algida]|nr:hypothetical protein LABALGNA3A7_05180 [Dellaglioa algida]